MVNIIYSICSKKNSFDIIYESFASFYHPVFSWSIFEIRSQNNYNIRICSLHIASIIEYKIISDI